MSISRDQAIELLGPKWKFMSETIWLCYYSPFDSFVVTTRRGIPTLFLEYSTEEKIKISVTFEHYSERPVLVNADTNRLLDVMKNDEWNLDSMVLDQGKNYGAYHLRRYIERLSDCIAYVYVGDKELMIDLTNDNIVHLYRHEGCVKERIERALRFDFEIDYSNTRSPYYRGRE